MTPDDIPDSMRRDLKTSTLEFYRADVSRARTFGSGRGGGVGRFSRRRLRMVGRHADIAGQTGRASTEPSKRTIQVLAELKQLEAFLEDNLEVPPGGILNLDKLNQRREMSCYSAALARPAPHIQGTVIFRRRLRAEPRAVPAIPPAHWIFP